MYPVSNSRGLRLGDSIFVVEADNGNVNTFQGQITQLNYGDITLNDSFSFSWHEGSDQVILLLEGDPRWTPKHRGHVKTLEERGYFK